MRDIGNRGADDLRRGLDAMKADVIARRIPPDELRGATITLSKLRHVRRRAGTVALVVVPPQAAIIGAGRIAPEVVAAEGRPAVRRCLPLSLTFDHPRRQRRRSDPVSSQP